MKNLSRKEQHTLLKSLELNQSRSIEHLAAGGTLVATRQVSGVVFLWRYSAPGGKQDRIRIGPFDPKAPHNATQPSQIGYSVEAAATAAKRLAEEHFRGVTESGTSLREKRAAIRLEKAKAVEEDQTKASYSLWKLLEMYCDYLQSQGRRSHSDFRIIARIHVVEAWPKLAAKPACEITKSDVMTMLRATAQKLNAQGRSKGKPMVRTSNKLRSMLMAAYRLAMSADSLATIPIEFQKFGIVNDPTSGTRRDTTGDKADKNPLSVAEMRQYWKLVKGAQGVSGAMLRIHLLTGAQRIHQLCQAPKSALKDDVLVLTDSKGRPGKGSRKNIVPLIGEVLPDVKMFSGASTGEWLFSSDGGKTHISPATVGKWSQAVVGDKIPGFIAKRLRSGVETMLAAAGVSREVRGHLQSHGVTGIQASHYDAHDYVAEKCKALSLLLQQLNS